MRCIEVGGNIEAPEKLVKGGIDISLSEVKPRVALVKRRRATD